MNGSETQGPAGGASPLVAGPDSRSERRQISVFFCDLVDSTALCSRLDPEDFEDLMRRFRLLASSEVQRHGGLVVRYMGDGMLAYFGYPRADEGAHASAIRCGLSMLRRLDEQRAADGPAMRLRISAATGIGIVGDLIGSGAAAEVGVSGMVANLAARIQGICPHNAMLVADETQRLTGRGFDFRDAGKHSFNGIDGEVQVWQPLSEKADHTRYELPPTTGLFVGREHELGELDRLWRTAREGRGQVALVRGEPGVGKTALLRQLERRLSGQSFVRILLQCSSPHTDSPLRPLALHLLRAAGITSDDSPEARLRKIEALVGDDDPARHVPLLAELLSIPLGERHAPLALLPAAKKLLTQQFFVRSTRRLALQAPVLLLLEDAHWIDPTSEELAGVIAAEMGSERLLVVVSARPEYRPKWEHRDHVVSLALTPLTDGHIRDLVTQGETGALLQPAVIEQIVARSGGIPLFAEELARTMTDLQQGPGSTSVPPPIPETLRDSLMARIDRLGEFKELAQAAAVLGRKFSLAMLQAVDLDGPGEAEIGRGLDSLVASGLVSCVGGTQEREYVFRHALIHDCAYDSLLRSRRQRMHRRVAESLEGGHCPIIEAEPELLAYHWTSAGQAERALPHWLKASQRCVSRGANLEAIRHARQGLKVLEQLPASVERDALDFHLHLALGQASYVVDGPAAPATTSAYARSQSLLEVVSDSDQRMTVLYGIFSSYHFASRFDLAREPAERALELAERESNPFYRCQAHRMLGYIAFFMGDCAAAHAHFTALYAAYDAAQHGALAARYGADCRVGAAGFHALVQCVQGDVDGALRTCARNLDYARTLGHPASLGWAYASAGYLHYYRRDPASVMEITAEGIAYCEARSIGSWLLHCQVFHIWAKASLGLEGHHPEDLRRVIATVAAGNSLGLPLVRTTLAEVLLLRDAAEEALLVMDTALQEMDATSQLFFEPMVCLVHQECLNRLGQAIPAAAAAARAAMSVRRMDARLFEGCLTRPNIPLG